MATSPIARWRHRDRVRTVAAVVVGVVAVVGILSGISAPLHSRLRIVLEFLPFHAARAAAATLVLVSFALLLTARGLRRGGRLAWGGTLALLVLAGALNVAKGLDIEEAILAFGSAGWLAAEGASFPVLPGRAALRRAAAFGAGGTLGAVALGVTLSMSLGRHHHPRLGESARAIAERLGGNSALPIPGAGRFVTPMLVAVGVGIVGSTLWVLLSPRLGRRLAGPAHLEERERARAVIREFGGGTLDYFALRDDKEWFFTERSVVAYAVRRGVCLVSPDPIGPTEEREATWAEFVAFAERHGWSLAVVGASDAWLPVYEASGFRVIYMGDEAIVGCGGFTLDTPEMKSLRNAYNRVKRAGCVASFVNPLALSAQERARIEEVSGESRVGESERGFSMTLSRFFDPHDDDLMMTVVSDGDGVAQAFLLWVPAPAMRGWSLDVMRRNPEADLPNGVMDFAILETIFHVAPTGGALGLNFALFRDVVHGSTDRPGARFSRFALRALAGGLEIESLGRFNAKYGPRWQPRYVALDSAEYGAAQGFAIADAEGIRELPIIGRFLGRRDAPA